MGSCRCSCTAYGGDCDCRFDGKKQGAANERFAIVKYLRENDDNDAANEIERGDHLQKR